MGVLLWVMDAIGVIRNRYYNQEICMMNDSSVVFDRETIEEIIKCGDTQLSYPSSREDGCIWFYPNWEELPVYLYGLRDELETDPTAVRVHRARMYALLSHVSRCNDNLDHFSSFLLIQSRLPFIRCLGLLP